MSSLSPRERILAASRGQLVDQLPFFHWWRHCQTGWAERECRNRGMGMCWMRPCATEVLHGVDIVERTVRTPAGSVVRREYVTPVGTVYTDERREPGTGQWHGQRSWRDVSPATTETMIKTPEDYAVVQYMVEHTEYVADPFPVEQAMDWLGDEGIVMLGLPYSPMQTILLTWVGTQGGRCYYHMNDYPDEVAALYEALCRARRPLYEIAAQSAAPVAMCGDNLDGFLVNPKLFRRYFMPAYEEQAAILHANDKLMAVHMDGRLGVLKDCIAESPVDIIEAFHPIPMGDVPLSDALAAWPDKVIWVGFPGSIYAMGPEETRRFAQDLLREAGSGERLVIEVSTENLVSNECLLALTSVLEDARLPLDGAD